MTISSNNPITVLCIDDSRDITALLELALNREPGMKCVGCLHEVDDLQRQVNSLGPSIVLIDLGIPNTDTLATIRELARQCPQVRVVAFSGYDDPETIDQVVEAGAWGLVSKHQDMQQVVASIRQVAAGALPTSG